MWHVWSPTSGRCGHPLSKQGSANQGKKQQGKLVPSTNGPAVAGRGSARCASLSCKRSPPDSLQHSTRDHARRRPWRKATKPLMPGLKELGSSSAADVGHGTVLEGTNSGAVAVLPPKQAKRRGENLFVAYTHKMADHSLTPRRQMGPLLPGCSQQQQAEEQEGPDQSLSLLH